MTNRVKLKKNYKPSKREKYMCPQHLEYFRLKLLAWRDELVEESRETISNLQTEVRDVGDEALLIARMVPTLVARDREAGVRAIESGPHPVTVVVMDDGLQNPSLAKSLTLAVIDGRRGIGNGLVMPAGPLRAPLQFQLELTDAVLVNGGEAEASVAEWLRRRFAGPVLRTGVSPGENTDWLRGARVVAWAGIGAPQRFFERDRLAEPGCDLAATINVGNPRIALNGLLTLADELDAKMGS